METATNNPEASPPKTSAEIVADYIAEVEKFLRPPYTFDLPPSEEKLMPGDQAYDYYVCRLPNLMMRPMLGIENLLADPHMNFDETSRSRLQRAHDILWSFTHGHNRSKNRTVGQMAFIRETIEDVVKALDEFLRAHEADKK